MKIGIDASRAQVKERTGTENYSQNLILALSKIDSKNSYRLYFRRSDKDFCDLPKNFEKKFIGLPRLWTQVGLAFEVLKNPPDLLFIPAHTLPIIRRPSLKTVVTVHDLGAEFLPGYHTFGGREYLLLSTRYAVKNATALIAVSQATKHDLIEKLGADHAKIFVVYEGVDHHFFKPQEPNEIEGVKAKYKISGDYFLFVGTIQPRKNLVRLIEAFAKLGERKNLNFVLAGKKGWLADEIYQAPKKFKVEEKVRFLDYVVLEDLPALYSGCLAFVLPSLVEGFGLPVLEAMACGAPVILSTASSLTEVGGSAALYMAPDNTKELVNHLTKVLDPNLREKLSVKSIDQAQKFSWEKCAEETLEVFERIHES